MEVRKALIEIKARTPLLFHADDIEWSDLMQEWQKENKGKSKAGDDRTPPWRWIGALNYTDPKTGVVAIPAENIMKCIMEGASMVTVRGAKTFKSQSQSGLAVSDVAWPILVSGKPVKMSDINQLKTVESFAEHKELVKALGFELFVKRAGVNGSKHVRVRPRFDDWSMSGEVLIFDDMITLDILQKIMTNAGMFKGIGNWRPSSKTPGMFGTFEAKVKKV